MSDSDPGRRAGAAQAIVLLITIQLPVVPIMALAPNLPLLFRHFATTQGKEFLVPMIITLPSLGIVLLGPVAGILADRWGRRRLLLWALALFSIAGLAPLLIDDLRWILAAQALLGVAEAVIITNGNTLLGDYFETEQRNRWLGVQSIIGPIFSALITLAAGLLGNWSWHGPFAVNAIALVMCLWMILTTWEPRAAPATRSDGGGAEVTDAAAGFPWRRMAPVYAITVLTAIAFYVPAIHYGLVLDTLGAHSSGFISLLTTIATVGSVASGYYFHSHGKNPARFLPLIYLCFGVGFVGLSVAANYWIGLAFGVIINFGFGLTLPALIALALQRLPERYRGRGMGVWMSSFFCAQFLCPPTFALVMHAMGGILPGFGAVGAVCLAGAVACWFIFRSSATPPTTQAA